MSESDSGSPPQDTERIKKLTINFATPVFNQDGTALSPAAFTVTTTDNPDPDIPASPTLSVVSVQVNDASKAIVTLDQPENGDKSNYGFPNVCMDAGRSH